MYRCSYFFKQSFFYKTSLDKRTGIRYIIFEHMFGGDSMEVIKLHQNKISNLQDHSLLEKETDPLKPGDLYIVQERFSLLPQMPAKQVKHFLTRSYQTKKEIIIQINPTRRHPKYVEVTGQAKFLNDKKQLVIISKIGGFTYLLNPEIIRHIRLLDGYI